MSELIVGIDLGTTNSAISIVQEGVPRILPVHGQLTMPSAVGLDLTGHLVVGQAAKNQQISAPERTLTSIKRQMGEDVKVTLGEREFSPEEISSIILKELKNAAEKELGQPVKKAVITVPAFFNERQRKATQIAGDLAGLEVVRIINEPTAAALAYGAGREDGETMLVYDLGGGTFDVSLVRVEQGVVEVKASHGDTHLGGDDFDEALVGLAVDRFRTRHRLEAPLPDLALRRLKGVMENAKIRLSEDAFVDVREEYLLPDHHLDIEVSREDYEKLLEPWLEKTLACVYSTLRDAGMTTAQVNKVMLVGGATRTPAVQDLLRLRMGFEPHFEINPDLIVAMGAAVQGAIIAGLPQQAILVDITPHTYSIGVLDQSSTMDLSDPQLHCSPVINRNTPLPCRRSQSYFTVIDGQKTVKVEVYQGEDQFPDGNLLVGHFTVEGLSGGPAESVIIVEFHLDLNGMLKVTAVEKVTGLAKSVVLDTRGQHLLNLDAARSNLSNLYQIEEVEDDEGGIVLEAEDVVDSQSLLATAKSLRLRAETLLAKGISEDDTAEVHRLLDGSHTAIRERHWETLASENEALGDVLFYLED